MKPRLFIAPVGESGGYILTTKIVQNHEFKTTIRGGKCCRNGIF
ncbi:hypothetical protein KKC1_11140 [Calderihabitans maritimus]|uniref:Uncharacterized protein n=1 Tax=Calderihabitans maritimus TaxID=1246530 RepID=A0A1Z5HR18_9FIRM|nr:hypothetical protein KKC1_11140 [Calderihabitans maritimus]